MKVLLEDRSFYKKYTNFKKVFNREPSDSWITKQYAKGRESYRSIIDLEFLHAKQKPHSTLFDDQAIDSLSKIAKVIASGQTTDYDLFVNQDWTATY